MTKHFFDFEGGGFCFSLSDNMAMDSDGNMLMRMGNNMAIDMDSGDLHNISFRSRGDYDNNHSSNSRSLWDNESEN